MQQKNTQKTISDKNRITVEKKMFLFFCKCNSKIFERDEANPLPARKRFVQVGPKLKGTFK
jgi:hypothetical protein